MNTLTTRRFMRVMMTDITRRKMRRNTTVRELMQKNTNKCDVNGGGRIRTYVGIIQQIYSLSRLAASVHPHSQVRSVAVR